MGLSETWWDPAWRGFDAKREGAELAGVVVERHWVTSVKDGSWRRCPIVVVQDDEGDLWRVFAAQTLLRRGLTGAHVDDHVTIRHGGWGGNSGRLALWDVTIRATDLEERRAVIRQRQRRARRLRRLREVAATRALAGFAGRVCRCGREISIVADAVKVVRGRDGTERLIHAHCGSTRRAR